MKRMFNIEVKRSQNFQSVSISEGYEGDFSDEQFETEKQKIINRVHAQVRKELKEINTPEFNLEVKK